ncbi:MAG: iron-containing alcohol dehydrogenase [Oscillospiraceae bacterium]|jgi:alcohol dehydrogenase YqhD (iron-dependent ADH family)|nr:iron-containing alcohol dehydrogenase [Oscillospiraceae bacterium]
MLNFDFHTPTYFDFGDGAEKNVGKLVRLFGGTKVLLHYGGGSVKRNGVYDAVVSSLNEASLPFIELGGVKPNPRSGLVYEGIELCRREGVDFVLAIGGGSSIDSAKAIAMGVPYDGDFWDFFGGTKTPEAALPVGTVLTIAAAGSEGSYNAVITLEDGNIKAGNNPSVVCRPKFSIMNPRYTFSLPPYQTACGITDMMAHICERYFTNTKNVDVTDRLSEVLLKTIIANAPTAVNVPDDYDSHAEIMWAGMLAHNNLVGVGREQDWSSHGMEHELSALFDVAHGAGLAVVMPAWMEFVVTHDIARFAQFAVRVWGCDLDYANPEKTAREGIARFKAFLRSIGMPITLSELGIPEDAIPKLVAHRAKIGFPLGSFVKIGADEMTAILNLAK